MGYTKEEQIIIDFWAGVEAGNKADNSGVIPEGWRTERHLPYIQDYNPDHTLNLYYPQNHAEEEKLPTIINIHGGGWMFGHVDDSENYMAQLAACGYAVMGMGYRLVPYTDIGGIVKDIYASLHWLEEYGPKRGFDLNRVMLTGDSAGAHLSLLTACIQKSSELQKIYGVTPVSFDIKTVGISCPAVEMESLRIISSWDKDEEARITQAYIDLMLGEHGKAAPWSKALSFSDFIKYVDDPAVLPPVFLIGSENESLHDQTKQLVRQFDELGIRYESLIWKKEDGPHLMHVFNVERWEWLESRISRDRMLDFFNRSM